MKKIIFVMAALVMLSLLATGAHAIVSLTVTGRATSATVNAGDQTSLVVTIQNTGTDFAQNVKLSVTPNPYIISDQTQYDIGNIAPSTSQVFTIPIKISQTAPEISTALIFQIDYDETGAGTKTIQSSVSISITKRILIEVEDVVFSESVIQKGDEVSMNVIFKNVGTGAIKDLSASLEDNTLPFVYTDYSKFLGDISPGQTFNASFTLIVNNDADTIAYNIPVNLTYFDEAGNLQTGSKSVGIKVSGTPDFVIILESVDNAYTGSQAATFKITVANRGTASAQFLTAKFDSNLYVTPSENYIGTLNPDDSSTISVDGDVSGLSVGMHTLNVTLLYKDPYNIEFSQSKLIQFEVTNRPIEISTNLQIIIVLAVIVILYWKRNFIRKLIRRK